jgi:hypothetical protein
VIYNVGFLYFQAMVLPALCFLKIVGKRATNAQVYISASDLVNFMFFQMQLSYLRKKKISVVALITNFRKGSLRGCIKITVEYMLVRSHNYE